MTGPASTVEWLVCSGIGCCTGVVLLGLVKLTLDSDGELATKSVHDAPSYHAYQPPPALPARAPVRGPQHAAPLALAETQPIRVLHHARHAKKAA
ncbi:hypothetical protein JHN63_02115 [Streptomyces sp. MBT65]|uniref:hypothetical protein n=1 Tax=Streptomyces sp. MBT65 TaxID=1488395 RepID=UPI00190D8E07|nr:hypothetical protein [Streptomyces sp. MBT65]MBK3572637.1 hypothetical protein [Streptomyces sp. MBT65]